MKIIAFVLLLFSSFLVPTLQTSYQTITPENTKAQYSGRFDFSNPQAPRFSWSGSEIVFSFEGSHCTLLLKHFTQEKGKNENLFENYFNIFIDNQLASILKVSIDKTAYELANNLAWGRHTIRIFKRTEAMVGWCEFLGFKIDVKGKVLDTPNKPKRKIEFIGDSITCGYGNEGDSQNCKFSPETENAYLSYASIAARDVGAQSHLICYSGRGVIQNYNKTNKGTLPELYEYIYPQDSIKKWSFQQWTPDAVCINLGTNDFAHEIPDSTRFVLTYSYLISRVLENHAQASIFCVAGSMLKGEKLIKIKNYLNAVVNYQNRKGNRKIYFFEMSTQGEKGYGCDWHPNVAQHQQNAKELSQFIKQKMKW
jgi:lysophospholipase L1-like esterase